MGHFDLPRTTPAGVPTPAQGRSNFFVDDTTGQPAVKLDDGTVVGLLGTDGEPGQSAYELAVANGFDGTEQEWLDSLGGSGGGSNLADAFKGAWASGVDVARGDLWRSTGFTWLAVADQDGSTTAPAEIVFATRTYASFFENRTPEPINVPTTLINVGNQNNTAFVAALNVTTPGRLRAIPATGICRMWLDDGSGGQAADSGWSGSSSLDLPTGLQYVVISAQGADVNVTAENGLVVVLPEAQWVKIGKLT